VFVHWRLIRTHGIEAELHGDGLLFSDHRLRRGRRTARSQSFRDNPATHSVLRQPGKPRDADGLPAPWLCVPALRRVCPFEEMCRCGDEVNRRPQSNPSLSTRGRSAPLPGRNDASLFRRGDRRALPGASVSGRDRVRRGRRARASGRAQQGAVGAAGQAAAVLDPGGQEDAGRLEQVPGRDSRRPRHEDHRDSRVGWEQAHGIEFRGATGGHRRARASSVGWVQPTGARLRRVGATHRRTPRPSRRVASTLRTPRPAEALSRPSRFFEHPRAT
jgi:hypothetical protein